MSNEPQPMTRAEFIDFLTEFARSARTTPDKWENDSLESYLEACAAWLADSDKVYRNWGKPLPDDGPWNLVADMLQAGRIYE